MRDELVGWRKQGGELRLTAAPVHSGAAAAFFSETGSTKWAYQTAQVDPGLSYEFQGYVQTSAGVSESYLRISWYESSDGGGWAIATVDSMTRVGGGSAGFAHLTTGAVRPPASAASARLRVMLAPLAASATVVYLDDFRFGAAALVASTPTATPTAAVASATVTLVPPTAAAPAIPAPKPVGPSLPPVASFGGSGRQQRGRHRDASNEGTGAPGGAGSGRARRQRPLAAPDSASSACRSSLAVSAPPTSSATAGAGYSCLPRPQLSPYNRAQL